MTLIAAKSEEEVDEVHAERIIKIAIVYPGESRHQSITLKFVPLFDEFTKLGVHAEPCIYHPSFVDDVYKQLLAVDAALVWVNPIEGKHDRTVLDNMLRKVSDAGVYVSAHPDIIRTMGTKEILFKTRHMEWGLEDTVVYNTMEQMTDQLGKSLAEGQARVLKRNRGQSGSGVWLVYQKKTEVQQAESSTSLATMLVHVRHAERGAVEQIIQLDEFINYLHVKHGCFDGSDDGKMIDQAFQPRLSEGMIRAYMVHDKVGGFGHQVINALHPDTPLPDCHPRQYYPPYPEGNEPCDFQPLKHKLEDEWIPQLMDLLGLTPDMLPVIWDADFMFGPKDADGTDTNVLCEINMSCVSPYPDAATPLIAGATMQQVLLARSRSLAATSEERQPVLFLDCMIVSIRTIGRLPIRSPPQSVHTPKTSWGSALSKHMSCTKSMVHVLRDCWRSVSSTKLVPRHSSRRCMTLITLTFIETKIYAMCWLKSLVPCIYLQHPPRSMRNDV